MRIRAAFAITPLLLAIVIAAPGCGDRSTDRANDRRAGAAGDEALPAPERTAGSVTGMPGARDPRDTLAPDPNPVSTAEDPLAYDDEGNPLPPQDPLDPAALSGPALPDGLLAPALPGSAPPSPPVAPAAEGPGPAEAVALLKAYYDSINAGSYGSAYTLWSGNGDASGQSPQQFADSYSGVSGMSIEIMAPGRVGAAAGSRYIEVPVAVSSTRADGSVHKFLGTYTLRRAVVDGASEEQRAWRIASADIREVQP